MSGTHHGLLSVTDLHIDLVLKDSAAAATLRWFLYGAPDPLAPAMYYLRILSRMEKQTVTEVYLLADEE